ncbi:MAG TPA: caspase family protein, partial [Polyangiaceae bacterium LLY-WYZ-15_(1-7)]|nr:caspase family protein [Polyangiaceae bacterium LLY-WYZ-15_(1-7)]
VEARSTAFDTYLILREPSGEQQDNDDAPGGGTTNSRIDLVAQQAGAYQVTVTSYRPGEQGPYQLVVSDGAGGGAAAPSPAPAPQAEAQPATGDMVRGELAQGDQTLDSGEFADAYSRSFQAGQSVQIRLASSALDPYLIVRTPSGRQLDNDDLTPQTRNAGVDIPAAEAGTYRILATSYRPGETGAYELSFGAGQAVPRPSGAGGSAGSGGSEGGRVFGLFAGITDYPDGVGDLPECANDAIKLAETLREAGLLQEANQVVLTDAQANRQNMRDAMQRFAGEMGPEDIFVFFYSGHGGQTQGSSDPREIDGTDEYLVLHDGPVLDNDLATLFDPVRARVSVVALDACFSGGFAKDLITRPGRVGFFSSEEDVLSAVAGQFQAGGYLSHFIRLAVSGDADMSPRDRVLTVGELSHFLYTQFGRHATDVQLQGAYQHLVVDRGAVTSDQVLWAYR